MENKLGKIYVENKPDGCTKCPFCADGNCVAEGRMIPNVAIEESKIKNGDAPPAWCPVFELSPNEIYRSVDFENRVCDAVNQVAHYMSVNCLNPEDYKFDYEHLAELYMNKRDCNVPENDMWQFIIDIYFRTNF